MSIGSATSIKRFIHQPKTEEKLPTPRCQPDASRPSPMQTLGGSPSSFESQKPKTPTNIKPEPTGAIGPTGPMTEAQKYDYYKSIIEQKGDFDGGTDKRNLLAFRSPTAYDANYGKGSYDDTMVMLWKDKDGNKHVKTYHANTEPNAWLEDHANDVNGDGRGDPARIPEGQYQYEFDKSSPEVGGEKVGLFKAVGEKPWWGLGFKENSPFAVDRDTKHDGSFSTSTGSKEDGGWNVQIHAAHEGDDFWAKSGVGSAGCVSVPNSEFKQLLADMGDEKGFKFTVVNQSSGLVPVDAPPTPLNIPPAPAWAKDAWEKRKRDLGM
ncbi:hypothetical protein MFUL124B02_38130 [Myxococcus fulvus 124B02]|nr:hypothetical protein MFUL124B02_38130 [Myxococcus fulvus 124B02]